MKRKFTKLMAALALLVFMMPSLAGWGQTRAEGDTHDFNQSLEQLLNNNNSISSIEIPEQSYPVKKVTISYRYNKTIANAVTMEVSVNGTSWGTQYSTGTGSNYTTVDFEGTSATGAIVISFTNNTGSGTGHGTFYVNKVTLTEGPASSTPSISADNVNINAGATSGSITYQINNGTNGASVTAEVLSGSTIGNLAIDNDNITSTSVPFTCDANTANTVKTATVRLSYGNVTKNVTITQARYIPEISGYNIDFEYDSESYVDWTFSNMESKQSGNQNINAHSGSYYGTTGGKATASITTNTVIAAPDSLICYVSKQSNNTTSSTWYIQVKTASETTWTDVKTQNATSMSAGTWVKFAADLSSYSNVYVRVYYDGSTAVRNIDDLSLTMASTDPVINANNVTVTHNAISGTIDYTITRPVDGASLTANILEGGTIANLAIGTITNETVPFTCDANDGNTDRTTIVRLTYTYNTTETVTKDVTITQEHYVAPTPTITANNVEIGFNATGGSIAYTLANTVQGGVLTAAVTDGNWLTLGDDFTSPIAFTCVTNNGVAARTATVTLTYTYNNNETVTKEVTVTQNYDTTLGTVDNPYTVAQARAFIDGLNGQTSADGKHVSGIISQVDSYSSTYYSITYWISDDGTTTSPQLEVYSGKGIDGADFSAVTDVAVGAEVVVKGKLKYYSNQSVYEFDYNNELVSYTQPTTPLIDATAGTALAYDATDGSIVYEIDNYVTGAMTATTTATWISNIIVVDDAAELGEVTFDVEPNTATENRTATVTLTFTYGNKTTSANVTVTQLSAPAVWVTPTSITVDASGDVPEFVITYASLEITSAHNFDVEFFNSAGTTTVNKPTWIGDIEITASTTGDSYDLAIEVNPNTTDERYAYFKIYAMDDNGMEKYSDLVTITQRAPFQSTIYTRATSITSGGHYIIVGFEGNEAYAMGDQNNGHYRNAIVISEDGSNAIVVNEDVYEFTIQSSDDNYTIYDSRNDGYLYASSSNKNYMDTQNTNDDNGIWSIEIDTDGEATVISQGDNSRDNIRFNYNSGSPRFSCYQSNSSVVAKVFFYVKSNTVPSTNNTTVAGTDFNATTPAGYRLIASPVNMLNPKAIDGMLTGNYDLYAFDQNEEDAEWRNYKAESFLLESGKGYLYASENGVTLNFIGAPYAGNGVVNLNYTSGNTLAGWNLIGNPYNVEATLDIPYYRLNSDGSALNASTEATHVHVMEGVFVQSTAANETATFTAQATGKGAKKSIAKVELMLNGNKGVIDNAIVRFDEGQTLEKFMLNANGTKLYFTEGNKDYAIVRSNNEGEMPVSFKASANGTYTLSVNLENVEMNYLHLIDNMTGTDVDLLANPSYSFEAKTTDYANRFRLMFDANSVNEQNDEAFAFFNGSEWVVSNMGEATLQVVDVMGRVLSSKTVNGNANVNLNQTAGVYMLRLVNGNSVKVQKVVVK